MPLAFHANAAAAGETSCLPSPGALEALLLGSGWDWRHCAEALLKPKGVSSGRVVSALAWAFALKQPLDFRRLPRGPPGSFPEEPGRGGGLAGWKPCSDPGGPCPAKSVPEQPSKAQQLEIPPIHSLEWDVRTPCFVATQSVLPRPPSNQGLPQCLPLQGGVQQPFSRSAPSSVSSSGAGPSSGDEWTDRGGCSPPIKRLPEAIEIGPALCSSQCPL